MNHPDFSTMTDAELRAYVLAHRKDWDAFYAYVDRMETLPPIAIIEPEDWNEERMRQILEQIEPGLRHQR
jgi:hypothetical protein